MLVCRKLITGLIGGLLLGVHASAADQTPDERGKEQIDQLESPDPKVRAEAACLVGMMETPPRRAANALAKALTLEAGRMLPGAAEEPPTCDCPNEPRALGARAEWLRACNELRAEAPHPIPRALRKIGGAELGVRAVMSLVRAESLPGPAHKEVSYLLAQLGPDAIPEFEKAIEDPNDVIRYIAIRALARIRPPTWEAEKALRKAGAELTGSSQNEALAALDELRRARRGERVRQRRMQPVRPR